MATSMRDPVATRKPSFVKHGVCHTRPPYFDAGTEVIYNRVGHRTKDEHGPPSVCSRRKWRTYIVRRNEYLTQAGKWMYQIAEIGGDGITLAADEDLIEVVYPPATRVEFGEVWNSLTKKKAGEATSVEECTNIEPHLTWIITACHLETGFKQPEVVYDVKNEHGATLADERLGVRAEQLAPYLGPKPDAEGYWRV